MKFTEGSPIPAIIGVGEALPPKKVTNYEVDTFMGKRPGLTDRIMRATGAGINERYWVEEGNSAVSTLAIRALEEALKMSDLEKGDINALWLGTSSGDRLSVSTPAIIQDEWDCQIIYSEAQIRMLVLDGCWLLIELQPH